ncbi:uncharacterized protein CcaverHIS019_0302730 [Cutaneotrichosporon cavernicola]|uniref:Peptidase C19 ubiquitin carboxyl-terminal hydrolase domain-containing protein n=1 Tax=Cutaneotrichosporon cavernicola TaxID=279322 RepID=A0AA48L2R7_9TREE|nr:uncharacterized protein CcaverHIS019_0302730 [Cutaneotrichosporon cavernicola]BEI90203.1 hypothetical protein CcaverHIS019_0302730 [Cutaneotrichosporon cavernicola]
MLDDSSRESGRIREMLIEFGVAPAIAHEASMRYSNVETAANWAYGDGANWQPQQNAPKDPFNSGVMGRAPSPVRYPSQEPQPFASNNPFNPAPFNAAFPPAPTGVPGMAQDDIDLARALAMSTEDDRAERERSVRASGPPPSPGPGRMDDEPTFGPSNKDDPQGSLAMVRTNTDNNNDKEEADLQRALQESMMTASFHSAGDVSDDRPPPTERDPDIPLVYVARNELSWAPNLLQGLAAVPQLSRLTRLGDDPSDPELFHILRTLLAMQNPNDYPNNYQRVDREIEALNNTTGVRTTDVCLPPTNKWMSHFPQILKDVVESRVALVQTNPDHELMDTLLSMRFRDVLQCPEQLLTTLLQTRPTAGQTHVTIQRTLSDPTDIHGNLSQIIWGNNDSNESILSMADVVFVALQRVAGVRAEKWTFDEEVILDRYMSSNIAWATQMRAQEHLMKTDLQRLQDQIDTLSTFRGQSLPDAVAALLKELEHDSEHGGRAEIRRELERVSGNIAAKLTTLKTQAEAMQTDIKEGLFATNDEDKNQHRYRLRSILWHDGFTTPGNHLYSYVLWKANWWKIEDAEVTKVDFDAIQNDKTGAFTDGGPYLLIYSRSGARPHGHSRDEPHAADEEQMDIESTLGSTGTLPIAQRGAVRLAALSTEDDEGVARTPQDEDLVMAEMDAAQHLQEPKKRPLSPQAKPFHPSPLSPLDQHPQQEVDMQEAGPLRPEPRHAHTTTEDKGDWELVENESDEKPAPVHRTTI